MKMAFTINIFIKLCTLASLFCGGCSHLPVISTNGEAKWRERRNEWAYKAMEDPIGNQRYLVRLMNFSTSIHIEGEENQVHGQMLSDIRKNSEEAWNMALDKASPKGAESSLVLVDAYESGTGFSYSPQAVILERETLEGMGSRAVSLDLSTY